MPVLDKAKIAIGTTHSSKLDLSHDHITTSNFMDLQPVMYRHMLPKEKLTVNARAFARLAPMAVPTFGRCRLNIRSFFVPFRTVFKHFTEFYEDTVSQRFDSITYPSSGIVSSTPIIKNSAFVLLFTDSDLAYSEVVTQQDAPYDFFYGINRYRFTFKGRRLYKLLRSLGYDVIWAQKGDVTFSALSILAYLRVYVDWYSVSAYMDTEAYQLFLSWFAYDSVTTPLELSYESLDTIYNYIARVCYDGDYFTSAWDNPVAPNPGLFSQFVIPDITIMGAATGAVPDNYLYGHLTTNVPYVKDLGVGNTITTNGTPMSIGKYGIGGNSPTLNDNDRISFAASEYQFTALKSLTDYMKRHQLSGARAVDRYLADFGINLPADKLNRSTYLGMSSIDITVGDVMSHADTAGSGNESNLGDYAGQGYMNGSKTFEFQASEFGLFLICASIVPSGGIVQGYDRNNLHTTKDQFFNADFDNLGVQSLAKGEVFISKNSGYCQDAADYDKTFGYVPRYAEYKVARDQLTGDIALDSVIAGHDSWHLFRILRESTFNSNIDNQIHSLDFCRGRDAWQYSRIFNSTDAEFDKFFLYYQFNVISRCPCQSLFDTYQFDDESKKINMDANGVKMN